MKYLLPLLILLAVDRAQANLGETQAQMEARYGKSKEEVANVTPTSKPQSIVTCHYTNGDYTIAVTFLNAKSGCEEYARKDGKAFTEDETNKILVANSVGSNWVKLDADGSEMINEWKLENGKAFANYIYGKWTLTIRTPEYLNALFSRRADIGN